MNENSKTIAFWGAALVMIAIGAFLAWPTPTRNELGNIAGQLMFTDFKDPLSAANMKIVTYDSEQAKLSPFEVRKDSESGVWTIPSRSGYPADAVEQMKDAANAFVALKILDIQTENAEDHDDLGVVEPKLEDLQGGEEGVGRLVSFKDDTQKTLASLIIGNPVKDEEGKIYVRKPGEDPVYVVKLDDSPLTTQFQDWIEEDLLQLSSIEIGKIQIKDYSASLGGLGNQVSWDRNYEATVSADGSDWTVDEFLVYEGDDPLADPEPADAPEGSVANKEKLDEMKNALDDLKIVDVVRKPEGMSASLKTDDKLVSDDEAYRSLLVRGFFPLDQEMISANGEMTVSLNDGVEYILRFGNVTGVSETDEPEEGDEEEETVVGVNRYLLVTTKVNDGQFPIPELQEVPKNLDDLDKLMMPPEDEAEEEDAPESTASPSDETGQDGADESTAADEDENEAEMAEEVVTENEPETDADSQDDPVADEEGETDLQGEAEAEGSGGGLQADDDQDAGEGDSTDDGEESTDEPTAEDSSDSSEATTMPSDTAADDSEGADEEEDDEVTYAEMTEEEKLELLEAEQEKITKANQRLLDARKDKIETARRRVRELNERFADWYYVIPEATYRKLRIARDELYVVEEDDDESVTMPPMPSGPSFGLPGMTPGG